MLTPTNGASWRLHKADLRIFIRDIVDFSLGLGCWVWIGFWGLGCWVGLKLASFLVCVSVNFVRF